MLEERLIMLSLYMNIGLIIAVVYMYVRMHILQMQIDSTPDIYEAIGTALKSKIPILVNSDGSHVVDTSEIHSKPVKNPLVG